MLGAEDEDTENQEVKGALRSQGEASFLVFGRHLNPSVFPLRLVSTQILCGQTAVVERNYRQTRWSIWPSFAVFPPMACSFSVPRFAVNVIMSSRQARCL